MNKYHILVCDDDIQIVRAIRIYLERAGYEVYEAYNGKQALEVLEENMSTASDAELKSIRNIFRRAAVLEREAYAQPGRGW